MTIVCPNCDERLEADARVGDEVECAACGRPFVIRSAETKLKPVNKFACYSMGILLGFLGVFIIMLTDGKRGASYAARGLLIHIATMIGIYAIVASRFM